MKISIIGSGNFYASEFIINELKSSSMIIAADGGLNNLLSIKYEPDIIIGDFDSMSDLAKEYCNLNKDKLIEFPPEKDWTDSYLSIEKALEFNPDEIALIGFTGSRLDHTLNNIFLLNNLFEMGINAYIIDKNNKIFILEGTLEIEKNSVDYYKYISILPTFEEIFLTTKGFKYEVKNLKMDFRKNCGLGISNEILEEKSILHIEGKGALVILSND